MQGYFQACVATTVSTLKIEFKKPNLSILAKNLTWNDFKNKKYTRSETTYYELENIYAYTKCIHTYIKENQASKKALSM